MTTKQSFPSSPRRDDDIDLHALLGTLLDHKWLIIGVTAVFQIADLYLVNAVRLDRVQPEPGRDVGCRLNRAMRSSR